jgi:hypothetical protein
MSDERRRQFRFLDPQLTVEKTEARNGQWVTSGQVAVEIMRGDDVSIGSLVFPFIDAESRDDATDQAMSQLRSVLDALERHLGEPQQAAA